MMDKFREFWVEQFNGHQPPSYKAQLKEPEKISMCKVKIGDADPIASLEYYHVIEKAAFTEAVELIDELEKFIEPQAKNMAETRYESGVYLGGVSLAEQALEKIKNFKAKGE